MRATKEARSIDPAAFNRWHSRLIGKVLRRPSITIRVAGPSDGDQETIYGFAVLELPEKIHLVYVRPQWRKMGIAREMIKGLDPARMSFTTWSGDVQEWAFEKYRGMRFTPTWLDIGAEEHGRAA